MMYEFEITSSYNLFGERVEEIRIESFFADLLAAEKRMRKLVKIIERDYENCGLIFHRAEIRPM